MHACAYDIQIQIYIYKYKFSGSGLGDFEAGKSPCLSVILSHLINLMHQILTHGHFHTFVACCCCNSLGKEKRRASHSAMVMIMGVQGSAVVANVVVARGAWRRQQTAMAASSFFSLQYLRNFLHCRRTNGQRRTCIYITI